MKNEKVIQINCDVKDFLEIGQFIPLQGQLKEETGELQKLKNVIIEHGFNFPFFVAKVNQKNFTLDGHGRDIIVKQLKDEGYKFRYKKQKPGFRLPVVFIHCKDRTDAKKQLLFLNSRYRKITEKGLYEFLNEKDFEINIKSIKANLDLPDINLIKFEFKYYPLDSDELNKIPKLPRKSKIKHGDLFLLDGKHRILCGDSTNKKDVELLMNSRKANLAFSSPPYWTGMSYEYQKTIEEINAFIKAAAENLSFAVSKDESRIVINTGTGFTTSYDKKNKRHTLLLIDKWTDNLFKLGWNLRHIRHWIKEGGLSSTASKTDIIDQHNEFIGTFENRKGKNKKFDDIIIDDDIDIIETFYNRDGKNRGQFRTFQSWALRGFWNDIKGNARQTNHVAAFPAELANRIIMLYSKKNELILDLFIGSGTTLISAENIERICYGMEKIPEYVELILQRYRQTYPDSHIECMNRKINLKFLNG